MSVELRNDHVPGRSQRWATVDSDIGTYVMGVAESAEVALAGPGFVGAYLHGSLAQGSFYRGERSEERRVGKECRSRWSPYH